MTPQFGGVQPGSLRLIVTIRPADGSDAGVASLTRTVNSASSASQLTASLQVNATMDAAARTETVEEEFEASCPPGFWCSVGNTIACPRSTYNGETDRIDQSACRPCPAHALTTEKGSTSVAACICEEGYFANRTAAPDDEGNGNRSATLRCESCPVSANCTVPGVTFEHLPLQEGHWRAHANTTDVRRCPGNLGGSACVGCGGALGYFSTQLKLGSRLLRFGARLLQHLPRLSKFSRLGRHHSRHHWCHRVLHEFDWIIGRQWSGENLR